MINALLYLRHVHLINHQNFRIDMHRNVFQLTTTYTLELHNTHAYGHVDGKNLGVT